MQPLPARAVRLLSLNHPAEGAGLYQGVPEGLLSETAPFTPDPADAIVCA